MIKICENFAKRWYGQEDLNSPTYKFDDCGLSLNGDVVIPSVLFRNAEEMINALAPHFFNNGEYYFKIVDDANGSDVQTCFNCAVGGWAAFAAGLLLASSF